MHQNEAKGPCIGRITSILEISVPEVIKVTPCHKFPPRVTIPPLFLLDYVCLTQTAETVGPILFKLLCIILAFICLLSAFSGSQFMQSNCMIYIIGYSFFYDSGYYVL